MSIAINIPPLLQTLADGMKQVDVDGSTVGECLEADEALEDAPDRTDQYFRVPQIIEEL